MKKLFILLAFVLVSPALFAQNPIKKFIRKHNDGPENISITIPGWLIGLASDIGMSAAEDDDERLIFSLASEFGTTRVLGFDTNDFSTKKDISKLLSELELEYGYERWATLRAQSGEQVELTVEMRGDKVRNIIAIVSVPDEDKTFLAHMKTNFTAEEVGEVLNRVMKE